MLNCLGIGGKTSRSIQVLYSSHTSGRAIQVDSSVILYCLDGNLMQRCRRESALIIQCTLIDLGY